MLYLLVPRTQYKMKTAESRDHSSITSAKRWVARSSQMLMFANMVEGWGWPNADVSKTIRKKKFFVSELGIFFLTFFMGFLSYENSLLYIYKKIC